MSCTGKATPGSDWHRQSFAMCSRGIAGFRHCDEKHWHSVVQPRHGLVTPRRSIELYGLGAGLHRHRGVRRRHGSAWYRTGMAMSCLAVARQGAVPLGQSPA
jgi:hypothetical protein